MGGRDVVKRGMEAMGWVDEMGGEGGWKAMGWVDEMGWVVEMG